MSRPLRYAEDGIPISDAFVVGIAGKSLSCIFYRDRALKVSQVDLLVGRLAKVSLTC